MNASSLAPSATDESCRGGSPATLTLARLRELLSYDAKTGVFAWRRGGVNSVSIGRAAGTLNGKGYLIVRIDRRSYRAHRLAYFYAFGRWPLGEIDHINGDRTDNRLANLRDVTRIINRQNQRRATATNRTGYLGVLHSQKSKRNPFIARIAHDGVQVHVGYFPTAEAAHKAYVLAKRRLHEGCTL